MDGSLVPGNDGARFGGGYGHEAELHERSCCSKRTCCYGGCRTKGVST
jgi:hypothetical protein